MGQDSKTILYRRKDMLKYLISISSSSYKDLRLRFDVTDKVITSDLAYLIDAEGVEIETKPGRYGYVRISKSWRERKIHLNEEEERLLVSIYTEELDDNKKKLLESILIKCCRAVNYSDFL